MRRSLVAVVVGVTLAAGAGVVLALADGGTEAPAPDQGSAAKQGIETSDVQEYTSLDAIAADTEEAAVVTAGTSTIEVIAGLPFTVTEVTVTDALTDGVAVGDVLRVRQAGQADVMETTSGPNLLAQGESYAVTLAKFHFAPGDDTGQWIIVGDGLWAKSSGGELVNDADKSNLPPETTVEQLEETVTQP